MYVRERQDGTVDFENTRKLQKAFSRYETDRVTNSMPMFAGFSAADAGGPTGTGTTGTASDTGESATVVLPVGSLLTIPSGAYFTFADSYTYKLQGPLTGVTVTETVTEPQPSAPDLRRLGAPVELRIIAPAPEAEGDGGTVRQHDAVTVLRSGPGTALDTTCPAGQVKLANGMCGFPEAGVEKEWYQKPSTWVIGGLAAAVLIGLVVMMKSGKTAQSSTNGLSGFGKPGGWVVRIMSNEAKAVAAYGDRFFPRRYWYKAEAVRMQQELQARGISAVIKRA
jgi:hypothetical protein